MKAKAITLIMAFFGISLIVGTVGTMDFFLMERISEYPPYLYYLLCVGLVMMLPAFIYGVLKGE